MEITHLVNRNIDRIVSGPDLEIVRFWGFHGHGKEDRSSTGGTDAEITFSFIYIFQYFVGDLYLVM
jgi:hypothetical protein